MHKTQYSLKVVFSESGNPGVQFSGLLSICAVGCRSLTRCLVSRPQSLQMAIDVYRCSHRAQVIWSVMSSCHKFPLPSRPTDGDC